MSRSQPLPNSIEQLITDINYVLWRLAQGISFHHKSPYAKTWHTQGYRWMLTPQGGIKTHKDPPYEQYVEAV